MMYNILILQLKAGFSDQGSLLSLDISMDFNIGHIKDLGIVVSISRESLYTSLECISSHLLPIVSAFAVMHTLGKYFKESC